MRDSKRRHWTSTMSSHRGIGSMHVDDILPPTPTTPLVTMTEDTSAADVQIGTDDVVGARIGPIESVLIRGRGQSRDHEHSVQAVGLTLTRSAPTPWPIDQEEGDSSARQV